MSDASKDELLERIRILESNNVKLNRYVENLLQTVLEKDPTLLEIKK